jgi:hypothetical protein
MLLGAAYSPQAATTPQPLYPYTIYSLYYYANNVNMGFLDLARAHGRLPKAPNLTPEEKDELVVRTSVLQNFIPLPKKGETACEVHPQAFDVHPKLGAVYLLATEPVVISYRQGNVQYVPQFGQQLTFVRSGLDFTIKNANGVPILPVVECYGTPKKGKAPPRAK